MTNPLESVGRPGRFMLACMDTVSGGFVSKMMRILDACQEANREMRRENASLNASIGSLSARFENQVAWREKLQRRIKQLELKKVELLNQARSASLVRGTVRNLDDGTMGEGQPTREDLAAAGTPVSVNQDDLLQRQLDVIKTCQHYERNLIDTGRYSDGQGNEAASYTYLMLTENGDLHTAPSFDDLMTRVIGKEAPNLPAKRRTGRLKSDAIAWEARKREIESGEVIDQASNETNQGNDESDAPER